MAGTKAGGLKTAKVIKDKYGKDYYRKIGSKGGSFGALDGTIKGFALNRELARIAGIKGGRISRRGRHIHDI